MDKSEILKLFAKPTKRSLDELLHSKPDVNVSTLIAKTQTLSDSLRSANAISLAQFKDIQSAIELSRLAVLQARRHRTSYVGGNRNRQLMLDLASLSKAAENLRKLCYSYAENGFQDIIILRGILGNRCRVTPKTRSTPWRAGKRSSSGNGYSISYRQFSAHGRRTSLRSVGFKKSQRIDKASIADAVATLNAALSNLRVIGDNSRYTGNIGSIHAEGTTLVIDTRTEALKQNGKQDSQPVEEDSILKRIEACVEKILKVLCVRGGRPRKGKTRFTQKEFANVLGVSEDTIARWDNGKSSPPAGYSRELRERGDFDEVLQFIADYHNIKGAKDVMNTKHLLRNLSEEQMFRLGEAFRNADKP